MKQLFVAAGAASVLALSWQASAITMDEVGAFDPMIAAGTSGGAADDAAFLNAVLGLSLTNEDIDDAKIESPMWEEVTDGVADEFALEFPEPGGFFLVKTGPAVSIDGEQYDNFLFQNLDSTSWATVVAGGTYSGVQPYEQDESVWTPVGDPATVIFDIPDIFAISHITPAGETAPSPPAAPISEPTAMLLLGTGLAGLASMRRRKK